MQNCPLKSTSFRCHIVGIFYMGILSKKALKSRVSNCNNSRNIFVDSAYIFQGINIDNVFDFNDSVLEISNILDDYDT